MEHIVPNGSVHTAFLATSKEKPANFACKPAYAFCVNGALETLLFTLQPQGSRYIGNRSSSGPLVVFLALQITGASKNCSLAFSSFVNVHNDAAFQNTAAGLYYWQQKQGPLVVLPSPANYCSCSAGPAGEPGVSPYTA